MIENDANQCIKEPYMPCITLPDISGYLSEQQRERCEEIYFWLLCSCERVIGIVVSRKTVGKYQQISRLTVVVLWIENKKDDEYESVRREDRQTCTSSLNKDGINIRN